MAVTRHPTSAPKADPSGVQRAGRLYAAADHASAALVYFLVVFTPWALGTTQPWAIWTANAAGFGLGILLLVKKLALRVSHIHPARWDDPTRGGSGWASTLLSVNVLVLIYILVSAVNNRAAFDETARRFIYRDDSSGRPAAIPWLPHSYDSISTWFVFWQALGLTCFFWALRDWLLGKTLREATGSQSGGPAIPARLRRLMWVVSLNCGAIAIEAIFQRFEGSGRVLFLVVPRFNKTAESQFGPWAYRSNATEYLNLIWPVIIGFWFWLVSISERRASRGARMGSDTPLVLLPVAILSVGSVFMASSRGGAIIAVLLVLGTIVLLVAFRRRASWRSSLTLPLVLIASLGLGAFLGWEQLKPRLNDLWHGDTSERTVIYMNATQMRNDFWVLGSGPGSFGPLYQLYRGDQETTWEAYAHNDWLEVLITFGIIGESLLLVVLALALGRFFSGAGIPVPGLFYAFILLSLTGCLATAVFDMPFRVYSCFFPFILLCSVAASIGRRVSPATG